MAEGFFGKFYAKRETAPKEISVPISADSSHHYLQVIKVFYVKTDTFN